MAMILTSDHREGGWEEQSRNTMMEPRRCSNRCNSSISREEQSRNIKRRSKRCHSSISREEQSRNATMESKRRKRCNTSSSIDDLSDELLVEILQRLPSKSAFRCKAISKRWFALISDHYFTRSFLRYHHTNKKWRPRKFVVNFYLKEFLLTSQLPEVRFPLNLSFLPCFQTSQEEVCVVASSNDLLLCCATRHYQSIYYICNPLTKQWTVLPPTPVTRLKFYISIGFISYPSYDKSQCSFKVVRLIQFDGYHSEFIGEIFSSETGRWTTLVLSCRHGLCMDHISRLAIVYNGMFHWVLKTAQKIFVYDLANDKTHAIDGPKGVRSGVYLDFQTDCLGLWRGRLRIAQLLVHNNSQYYRLKVWEYTSNTWRLMHRINLKELTWKNNSPLPEEKSTLPSALLAFHPYEDVMYLRFKDCVVSCNLQTKTLKFVSLLPYKGIGRHYRWEDVYTIVLPTWPTPVPAFPDACSELSA